MDQPVRATWSLEFSSVNAFLVTIINNIYNNRDLLYKDRRWPDWLVN